MKRVTLLPGVSLNCVTTAQFKTNVITVYFLRHLNHNEAALNALVPHALCRGNSRYPDLRSMSDALADLYGSMLMPVVQKRGEHHMFGLASTFVAESLHGVAQLILETLFRPVLGTYVVQERDNLINRIRAVKNDKASYSMQRLEALACQDEPYAVARLGDEETAASITDSSLSIYFNQLLTDSRVEIFYCGPSCIDEIKELFLPEFQALKRQYRPEKAFVSRRNAGEPGLFTDYEDVTQAKLALMWRCAPFDTLHGFLSAYTATEIYGGGAGKLFENVRERLSLCYYADARLDRHMCAIKARSGVEFSNIERAKNEILSQWGTVVNGGFTDSDISHAKASLLNSWVSASDSPVGLESFWQSQAAAGHTESLENWAEALNNVEKQDVVDAAGRFYLDAVYCMRAKND